MSRGPSKEYNESKSEGVKDNAVAVWSPQAALAGLHQTQRG